MRKGFKTQVDEADSEVRVNFKMKADEAMQELEAARGADNELGAIFKMRAGERAEFRTSSKTHADDPEFEMRAGERAEFRTNSKMHAGEPEFQTLADNAIMTNFTLRAGEPEFEMRDEGNCNILDRDRVGDHGRTMMKNTAMRPFQ